MFKVVHERAEITNSSNVNFSIEEMAKVVVSCLAIRLIYLRTSPREGTASTSQILSNEQKTKVRNGFGNFSNR